MKRKLFLLLCALLTMIGVQAQETPENNGVYYLYNEEADLFLSRGANWGTRAVAMPVGMPWKVTISDGKWTLHMYDLGDPGYGDNGYADNGSPVGFTPSGSAEAGYTLEYNSTYIDCPANPGPSNLSSTASVWKFLTQAQYEGVLVARSKAQDAAVAAAKGIIIPQESSLAAVVGDPDNWTSTTVNDGVPSQSTWSTSQNRGGTLNWGSYGSEMYQSNGHYTRTITGLEPGIYKVSVRAQKRVGSNGNCYNMGQAGYRVSDAYMSANGNIIPIKAWSDDCKSNSNPNSTGDFVNIVNDGGYTTEGFVYVDESGELSLNAGSEAYWGGCWFLFNGVSYTFYNNEVSDEDAATIIATAETTLESKMGDLYSQAIVDALDAFEDAQTIANYNALNTAITNAAPSIASYAVIAAGSVPDNSLDGWTCENSNTFHINTWSTEGNSDGSNMRTPFIENWVGKGSYLGAGRVYYQLQGLNPGEVYYAQALVRSYNEASDDAPNGPNFFINDKVVDMTQAGTTFTYNNMSGIYATLGGGATVGEDGTLTLGVTIADDRNYNWVAFKSVSIRSMQDALDEAREAANAQVGKKMNNDVAHALALALETYGTGTPSTMDEYITAIEALESATEAAAASAANYEEAAAIINAASGLDASGQATYAANESVDALSDAYDDGTLVAVSDEQKSACQAALSVAVRAQTTDGADWTLAIVNNSFETGNFSGWTNGSMDVQGNDSFEKVGNYYVEKWQPNGTFSVQQTIEDLPMGVYRVSAISKARSVTSAKIFAGDAETAITVSDETNTYNVEFTLFEAGAFTIGFEGIGNGTGGSWLCVDNFTMTYVAAPDIPTPAEKEALAEAIEAAEANTLGFEADEYAPYNNVEALEALAAAKAINPDAATGEAVVAATEALNGATWTANAEEVSAIYWPVYTDESAKDAGNRIYAIGWSKAGGADAYNTRVVLGTTESNVGVYYNLSNHEGLMTKFNTSYGEETGYTMPLKANTLYKLSFKYGGMENRPEVTVSFTDPSSDVITLAPNFVPTNSHAHQSAEDQFDVYEGYFVTNEAGDYVLNLTKNPTTQQQIAMGNIELKQVASQTLVFADDAMPTYAPGIYPAASYEREIPAASNFGTICVPFNVKSDDNIQYYTVEQIEGDVLLLETTEEVEAGVPAVFKKQTEDATSITVETADAEVVSGVVGQIDDPKLVGTFVATTVDGENVGNCYYIKNNQFWQGNVSFNIPAFRAYIETGSDAPARLNIQVDGETAINQLKALDEKQGLKDGKYLINGKVIVVKAGKQFYINGALNK